VPLTGGGATKGEFVYRGGTVDFLATNSDYTIPTNINLSVDTSAITTR